MLSAGAVYAGAQVASQPEVAPPIDEPVEDRLTPLDVAQPSSLRTCSVSELAESARLGIFAGSVINARTGEVLFDRAGDVAATPADLVKVLTGVAAIAALGPLEQFSTQVYQGSEPGSVVLVGGGDPTLSRLTSGESLYRGAPKLSTLAAETKTTWKTLNPPTVIPGETVPPTDPEDPEDPEGTEEPEPEPSTAPDTIVEQPITKVYYDTTIWSSADTWNADWDRSALTAGSVPRVVPLMIDGDRADPNSLASARGTDPALRAAEAFARALGVSTNSVARGSVSPGAALLAEVKSQPVHVLVRYMIAANDNTLAEMLARKVSSEAGLDGSAASLNQVIPGAVAQLGLDGSQISVVDGSGLSPRSTVSPRLIAQLMAELEEETGHQLAVYEPLPVAGESGSLGPRFTGANEAARGHVKGMAGAIATARTLGGLIEAEDGTLLAFAFYALGNVDANAAAAIDSLTAAVYACGNNLSNY